ncbi:MAG: anthranilate phosphoribosyltransferase [Phycisphaerales bacterium]
MQPILQHLLAGQPLSRGEADHAFELIFTGGANEMQVAAMLALLAVKGVTLDELVGGASAMRRHVTRLPVTDDPRAPLLDTCGTGGAPKTFNISTAAALVVAGARGGANTPVERVRVAKHGGRSRTGRGSAEVLALMGVNIDASPQVQARCLDSAGVCFSFAVNHHPAMKFAAGPRKSLGFPTIFNLLGPLTNPAGARRQLLGVWDGRYAPLVAQALAELGCDGAMVVHGLDGMDEITTCDQTFIARVRGAGGGAGGSAGGGAGSAGRVETRTFDPLAVGVDRARCGEFVVETAEASAALIERIVGGDRGADVRAARDIVLINAAAALIVAGMTDWWEAALALATDSVDSMRAHGALNQLREVSRGV